MSNFIKIRSDYFGNSYETINATELVNRIKGNVPSYEVITTDTTPKIYFDFDKECEKDMFDEPISFEIERILTTSIKKQFHLIFPNIELNLCIATCHTQNYTETTSKYSIRYFISNMKASQTTQLQFAETINNYILKNTDLTDYVEIDTVFDLSVYSPSRKMRCLTTSKPNENRPFILKQGTIENSIIQSFYDDNCEELILNPRSNSPTSVTQVPLTEEEEKMDDIDYLLQVCIQDSMCKEHDHKNWYIIGQALKNDLGDEAIPYFLNWTNVFGTENKKKEAYLHITKYIKKTPLKEKNRVTIKTIHYYARQSNEQKYKERFCKIKEFIIDEDIEKILKEPTENEIAKYFVKKWGNNFKCVDIKNKIVYGFTENKLWEQIDSCSIIREMISNELSDYFKKYRDDINNCQEKINENTEEYQQNVKKIGLLSDNIVRFGKTDSKNNITREILDKIIEPEFENILNKQKYILPIKNGKILNMKTLIIEDRTINHNFSYECDADYIQMTEEQENEVEQYFLDLFCGNKDTMMCVMDIFKSIMTGETLRYIYFFTGEGSNGKSLLFAILNKIFKKAMDTIDTRVILENKNSSSLTTEFEKLDKCRFGYVTELEKTDKLNVKTCKKISGGDPIDYRGLYKGNTTVMPTLNLGAVTNELPDFKAQTAIINRIVVVPFNNTFQTNKSYETEMLTKKDIIFSYIMKYGVIRDKFNLTEEMLVAKQDYVDDNETIDYLKDFIDKNYDIIPFVKKEKILRDNFRDNYNMYLKSNGLQNDNSTHQKFARLIKKYNIGTKESNGKSYYTGIIEKVINDESDEE